MSGTSPESTGDHTDTEKKDIPRKRSKVSRACDACRRKKVRCDAEFLTTLKKVTKVCTNCLRTNESCSFARIPLKRGPTKGYSRDMTDRAEESDAASRSRLGLDLAPYSSLLLPLHSSYNNGSINTSANAINGTSISSLPHAAAYTNGNTAPLVTPAFNNNGNGNTSSYHPHPSLSLSLTSTATSLATSISSMTGGNLLNQLSASQPSQPSHARNNTPPSPVPPQLVKPLLHRLKYLSSSPAPQIILPPLIGASAQPTVKLSIPQSGASTLSPGSLPVKQVDAKESRIQGPLWKVPYEMPTEASGLDPLSPANMSFNSRRSSVDLVSLILTSGLRSRLPSLQPLTSLNSELVVSDSDLEDVYVLRARASISPQNSISSLLSLNGRVGKLLTISGANQQSQLQPQAQPQASKTNSMSSVGSAGIFGHMTTPVYNYSVLLSTTLGPNSAKFVSAPYDTQSSIDPYSGQTLFNGPQYATSHAMPPANGAGFVSGGPMNGGSNGSLKPNGVFQNPPDYNFRVYYSRFHGKLPILPFDEPRFVQTLSDLLRESPQALLLVQLFYASLNNLVQFQNISIDASIGLLHHFLDLYPFSRAGVQASDNAVCVAMAALILINYTILIKGNMYSLAISIASGFLNDMKVMEKYALLCQNKSNGGSLLSLLDPDNVPLYLPRLQLCLYIIDNCYSISYGTQSQVQGDFDLLVRYLPATFPKSSILSFLANLPIACLFRRLLLLKNNGVSHEAKLKSGTITQICNSSELSGETESSFTLLFITTLKDKYEVYDFALEVLSFMEPLTALKIEEDDREQIYDFQLKVIRLVRKLSQSVLDFANFLSSMYIQAKSPSTCDESSNPYFNVSYGHSFKLIAICKRLLDSLTAHMSDNDIIGRLVKINSDLSISYNLLVSNLNNSRNNIGGGKSFRSTGFNRSSSGATLTPASDNTEIGGPGSACILLISSCLEKYNLSFNNIPTKFSVGANGNYMANISGWKNDFSSTFESLMFNEDMEGWY